MAVVATRRIEFASRRSARGPASRRDTQKHRPAPHLLHPLPELDRVDEKEHVLLRQQRGREGHRVVQDVATSDVEEPRHLSVANGVAFR